MFTAEQRGKIYEPIRHFLLDIVTLFGYHLGTVKNCDSAERRWSRGVFRSDFVRSVGGCWAGLSVCVLRYAGSTGSPATQDERIIRAFRRGGPLGTTGREKVDPGLNPG